MTTPTSGSGPENSLDHSVLMRSYGEALVRISDLEDEVARLEQLAGDQAPDPSGTGRVGALEKRQRDLESGYKEDGGQDPQVGDSDDTGQLKLHVASLANQLAQVRQELEEAQNKRGSGRRRSRSRSGGGHHRRWWRRWRKSQRA